MKVHFQSHMACLSNYFPLWPGVYMSSHMSSSSNWLWWIKSKEAVDFKWTIMYELAYSLCQTNQTWLCHFKGRIKVGQWPPALKSKVLNAGCGDEWISRWAGAICYTDQHASCCSRFLWSHKMPDRLTVIWEPAEDMLLVNLLPDKSVRS